MLGAIEKARFNERDHIAMHALNVALYPPCRLTN